MSNGDNRTANRIPALTYDAMAAEKTIEPKIVQVAREYDEARRMLQNLQLEHQKVSKAIEETHMRLAAAADHLRSMLEPQPEERRY